LGLKGFVVVVVVVVVARLLTYHEYPPLAKKFMDPFF